MDLMSGDRLWPQPLQALVLSGGMSRRMGQDKALMPHPSGGVWLTALVGVLQQAGLPVMVLTRHASHVALLSGWSNVDLVLEPEPWEGPLMALSKVLSERDGEPLLVCPVDMPQLTAPILQRLVAAWMEQPHAMAVADDGMRLQPLLAIIPSGQPFQTALRCCLDSGERRWLAWMEHVPYQRVRMPADALLNVNRPRDLSALEP